MECGPHARVIIRRLVIFIIGRVVIVWLDIARVRTAQVGLEEPSVIIKQLYGLLLFVPSFGYGCLEEV